MDIKQLNHRFGLAGHLEFIEGPNHFPLIKVGNDSATALISLYGGQVLAFKPHTETDDLLFVSDQSAYIVGKPIRGGIPICWPWFGADPEGLGRPNHGFVRHHFWQVFKTEAITKAETKISLLFNEACIQDNSWQQPFALSLEVIIGNSLKLRITTSNNSQKTFDITQALHTYFQVGQIKTVQVLGLNGCVYVDKLDHNAEKQQREELVISEEVDRIYQGVTQDLIIQDDLLKRRIQISTQNSSDAIVWNPWAKMADLPEKAYERFICVEVGNVAPDSIQIKPNEHYILQTEFKILQD